MEQAAEIPVAEAGGGELAAGDGLKELEVDRVSDAEGAQAAMVVDNGAGDLVEQFSERGGIVDRGECIEIALIGMLRDVRAPVKISDPLAQGPPGELSTART